MANSAHFSHIALVFHGKQLPEEATVVGNGTIMYYLQIEMPLPTSISIISIQNKRYRQDNWEVYPNSLTSYALSPLSLDYPPHPIPLQSLSTCL